MARQWHCSSPLARNSRATSLRLARFDASFSLRNESGADAPRWHEDEIHISVHVRHFESDDDGHDPQSLQAYEDAVLALALALTPTLTLALTLPPHH